MTSKEKLEKKEGNEQKASAEVCLNPQKVRLEQNRQRKALQAAREKKAQKSRSRPSREAHKKVLVKPSAEPVDCEYSVSEDEEDEEYKAATNETLKKLLVEKKKLEKALKLAKENEKKLDVMRKSVGDWFDNYEAMIDSFDAQLTEYEIAQQSTLDCIMNNLKQLHERWKESRKRVSEFKFVGIGQSSSERFQGFLGHIGLYCLRYILMGMAYCRDLISGSDSPLTSHSPKLRN
ncbi:unnamed protein product [Caenorhabditis sp. 36 PRJEB53466]|nr:unnamed protein product [Caenorhabditis sp. 36 PRJEB53466]